MEDEKEGKGGGEIPIARDGYATMWKSKLRRQAKSEI